MAVKLQDSENISLHLPITSDSFTQEGLQPTSSFHSSNEESTGSSSQRNSARSFNSAATEYYELPHIVEQVPRHPG